MTPTAPPVRHPSYRHDLAGRGWLRLVMDRVRSSGGPAFEFDGKSVKPARLREECDRWRAEFSEAGWRKGGRVVLAVPPSLGFVGQLLTALEMGLTVAVAAPGAVGPEVLAELDAHTLVEDRCLTYNPDPPRHKPSRDVALLLRTSGSTGSPRWVALSAENVGAVLAAHVGLLDLQRAVLLSALPWAHVFGLVFDLFAALVAADAVVRDPHSGRDPEALAKLLTGRPVTHMNGVPLLFRRLFEVPEAAEKLRTLRGGVVGGAAVPAALAEQLRGTKLRAGYGQTEASPGILFGPPGVWRANYLGRPLDAEVRVDAEGVLHYRGANACAGFVKNGDLERLPPDRWQSSHDIVKVEGDDYYFVTRVDDQFKLSNGRAVLAGALEASLREQVPGLSECLLFTPDGERLELLATPDGPADAVLSAARSTLGALGAALSAVHVPAAGVWVRTAKGNVDRRATLERFRESGK